MRGLRISRSVEKMQHHIILERTPDISYIELGIGSSLGNKTI